MKTLAFIFGGISVLAVIYFGVMFMARQAGRESGKAATQAGLEEWRRAMKMTPEQEQAMKAENQRLEEELEALEIEALERQKNSVATGVK